VSIHTGSELSGTFNAARLAAEEASVPVQLVDTRQRRLSWGAPLSLPPKNS
jgi:fatty acid-binding protein DegV